jgi:hypothetical protein
MENTDSLDILIDSIKYTSEIIINMTEKINSLEQKNNNIEQIINDQIKLNEQNLKKIEYLNKIVKELHNKENSFIKNSKKSIQIETESEIDFDVINHKEYADVILDKNNKQKYNSIISKDISEFSSDKDDDIDDIDVINDINKSKKVLNKNALFIEKLINHKNNLNNLNNQDINNEDIKPLPNLCSFTEISNKSAIDQKEYNIKKIDLSNEIITRTTQESLITRRRGNLFRKI